jgi:catechol 2,3-dioxygenase-like lactoylglutathione lyase family enzyme
MVYTHDDDGVNGWAAAGSLSVHARTVPAEPQYGTDQHPEAVMPAEPILDAIGIVASDVAASVAFYRRLGLRFPDGEPGDHVEAPIGTTGVRVMIDSEEMIKGLDSAHEGNPNGRIGLAVRLASAKAVDALYAELAADGFGRTEPWDAPWGQRYAQVADPDGQPIDLYAALPTS